VQWQPVYGDEWPDRYRVPDHKLADGDVVSVGDLRIEAHAAGAAESHADSWFEVRGARSRVAFIGDLAFHGVHPYTADGHTGDWIDTLDHLAERLAGAVLYPGHGAPGDVTMLSDQRRYLMMYREVVHRLAAGSATLSDEQKGQLTVVMTRFLPETPLTWMIELGADAVAGELSTGSSGPESSDETGG
jgi:glyoxylase-like metal-dependent hydrolase (beta-lactamase superfamily II)